MGHTSKFRKPEINILQFLKFDKAVDLKTEMYLKVPKGLKN